MSRFPVGFRWLVLMLIAAGGFLFEARALPGSAGVSPATATSEKAGRPRSQPASLLSAQVPPSVREHALFTFAAPRAADAAALDAALPAPAREIHYAHLNRDLVTSKRSPFWQKPGEGKFELPLPDGTALTIAIEASDLLGPDRFTSVGRVEGFSESRALFAWNAGYLHASVELPGTGTWALRTATREWLQFYQIDPALVPPCGGERRPLRQAQG